MNVSHMPKFRKTRIIRRWMSRSVSLPVGTRCPTLYAGNLQAYDLEDLREVAVKVHQLTSSWSEAKKSSYVKHATREFDIHKNLQHPTIVALLDIFELDANSFATVLELCTGGDLDGHLKEHTVGTS